MNTNAKQVSMRTTQDRSSALRANVKKYYIYVVLFLIVIIFAMVKVDKVGLFGRGAFLSPDSIINLLRSAVPILMVSGAFTLLMISGYIDLSVGSAMSLNAVVFAFMILNGFDFLPALLITLVIGDRVGDVQRRSGHEVAHHAGDRHPRDLEPFQGHRAVDRSGRPLRHQG